MTLTPRSIAVCRARMPSRSSIAPNQPAKPMAPNPSTLSRSPVAGKTRYSMICRSVRFSWPRSQVQDQARGARAGHADHHAVPGPALVVGQPGIEVIRLTVEDGSLAGAAGALGTGGQHPDAGLLYHVQGRPDGRQGERELAALQHDLERFGPHRLGLRLRREPLQMQGA